MRVKNLIATYWLRSVVAMGVVRFHARAIVMTIYSSLTCDLSFSLDDKANGCLIDLLVGCILHMLVDHAWPIEVNMGN